MALSCSGNTTVVCMHSSTRPDIRSSTLAAGQITSAYPVSLLTIHPWLSGATSGACMTTSRTHGTAYSPSSVRCALVIRLEHFYCPVSLPLWGQTTGGLTRPHLRRLRDPEPGTIWTCSSLGMARSRKKRRVLRAIQFLHQ